MDVCESVKRERIVVGVSVLTVATDIYHSGAADERTICSLSQAVARVKRF